MNKIKSPPWIHESILFRYRSFIIIKLIIYRSALHTSAYSKKKLNFFYLDSFCFKEFKTLYFLVSFDIMNIFSKKCLHKIYRIYKEDIPTLVEKRSIIELLLWKPYKINKISGIEWNLLYIEYSLNFLQKLKVVLKDIGILR